MKNSLRAQLNKAGFVHVRGFFPKQEIRRVHDDAKMVFVNQMLSRGLISGTQVSERKFESSLVDYFSQDLEGFVNCGKTCQHLISLHKLSVSERLIHQLKGLGLQTPNICTRPVMYFNSRHLAKAEAYYKSPPHQDWRSMQGSLNAMVVWVPLVNIGADLGALEVIPGSHLWGLQESREDEWYRHIEGTRDSQYQAMEVEIGDALFFSAFLVHRSGHNSTSSIRWSCHFRYNDLDEKTFILRKYPNPYTYKPQQDLVTPDFPTVETLKIGFSRVTH